MTAVVVAIPSGRRYSHITTQTTTVVRTGPCVLHSVIFNTATAAGVVTIYNNTAASGDVIAIITNPNPLKSDQMQHDYFITCSIGITVVTTVANQDLTVTWI